MSVIQRISARQILDSRATPTIEVEVHTKAGSIGRASVPSGASTGAHEAVELRDHNPFFYNGKSVMNAVENVQQKIAPQLIGQDVSKQEAIDELMIALDGTKNKTHLGANAILGVSLACARAAAEDAQQPLYEYIGHNEGLLLPMPMMNILNGGVHADNNMDIQEFMIVPLIATSFREALQQSVEVFYTLKTLLKKKKHLVNTGDEGGFAPQLKSNEEAIETVLEAIHQAGYKAGTDFSIALDAASTEMYRPDTQTYVFYKSHPDKHLSTDEMIAFWTSWVKQYPIFSIEDPMAEDDWQGWQLLSQQVPATLQLVGDDLFVTNLQRLEKGIKEKVANSILIKINQIGTITETIRTVRYAQAHQYRTIMSHRSGETEDSSIADLAVALNCGQIKTGGPSRSERTAKYNQLLRIEEQLEGKGKMFSLRP